MVSTNPSPPAYPASCPELLGLPRELRDTIYDYIIPPPTRMNLRTLRPPALALAKRQLFGEVMATLFNHNDFTLDVYFDPLYDPTQNAITANNPEDVPELAARVTAFAEHVTKSSFSREKEETDEERFKKFVTQRNRYLNASNALRDRFAFNTASGGSLWWANLVHPVSLIKDIEFQVYLPTERCGPDPDYTWELAVTAKLRVNARTQTLGRWVGRVGHRWPNCPSWAQIDDVTKAKHRQIINNALAQVKTEIGHIAKGIERRGKPLGVTMKNIEAVVDAFDTHGWWVDGLEPHGG